jgi:hypothetical protein
MAGSSESWQEGIMAEVGEGPITTGDFHTDEGELQIGDRVVRYECSGTGRPVLVLATGRRARLDLAAALASMGRVVVPRPPAPTAAPGNALSVWLPPFLDGLGLDRPPVVADGALAEPLLGLLLWDPFRLGPVALLLREDRDMPAGIPASGLLGAISHPLLLLPLAGGRVVPADLEPLLDFVRDHGHPR